LKLSNFLPGFNVFDAFKKNLNLIPTYFEDLRYLVTDLSLFCLHTIYITKKGDGGGVKAGLMFSFAFSSASCRYVLQLLFIEKSWN
jgi:hypothetical protein